VAGLAFDLYIDLHISAFKAQLTLVSAMFLFGLYVVIFMHSQFFLAIIVLMSACVVLDRMACIAKQHLEE